MRKWLITVSIESRQVSFNKNENFLVTGRGGYPGGKVNSIKILME